MKIKVKFIFFIFFLCNLNNIYSYEIIRDPIFEDYFTKISNDLKLDEIEVYLVRNKNANAFVINNKIYFTTGLLDKINNEDTLKAIYLHEYGHIIKNHFQAKNLKIKQFNNRSAVYGLLSLGIAALSGNLDVGIGTTISLNSSLINEISKHSINFEIEADRFMIDQIKKNKINTKELILFLGQVSEPNNNYLMTHPRSDDRIYQLKNFKNNKSTNSTKFEWIKSKYTYNSNNKSFNLFFENLEKGIFDIEKKINKIDKNLIQYEAFKKGFLVDDWSNEFKNFITVNDNSYLKVEYINYILDNNLYEKYYIIESLKFDENIMNEYFYYYIYGKYFAKIDKTNLSNFYFCQFYKSINFKNKSNFYCKKYDINDIPTLDKSYALFK